MLLSLRLHSNVIDLDNDHDDDEIDLEEEDGSSDNEVDCAHNVAFVKLPTPKSKKRKLQHNLSDAIRENRQNAR